MPAGDVELLRYRSLSDINGDNSIRRAQSEASVHECGVNLVGFSMLKLSKTRLTVGDSVTVYWDIHDTCSCNDWIGLFDLDYPTSLTNYLDCKQRGVTGARRGAIKWVISRNVDLNNVENRCIFKYIYANTGSVKAISPTMCVHNPYAEIPGSGGRHQANVSQDALYEISVSGLSAFGVKKNIFGKPSPYVKLSVIPSRRHFRSWKHHHGQIAKTSSQSHTIDPNWQNEEFVFVGGNDDILEIEVRNKFSGTRPAFSRFLGKLSISLRDVFEQDEGPESVVNRTLCKRTPSDRIQGRIRFVISTLNSAGGPSGGQETRAAGRENKRPSDLNVLSTHGATSSMMTSNPALRSSAPDLLRPTSDLSAIVTDSHRDPASPVSPFNVNDRGGNNVTNRRRNLPREMRPFSEFYSEEFVPLDPEISSPRNTRTDERTERSSTDEAASGASVGVVQEERSNVVMEAVETTVNDESNATVTIETPSAVPQANVERHAESQESLMDMMDSEGDVIEEEEDEPSGVDIQETQDVSSDPVNSVSSMRANVGSIELTEDSPLRILEESERALEEEATFSPRNLDDSDDMEEEIPDGAYGYLYVNPNDGDDEMDSERSTPDDDVTSITPSVISVDSWTYEQNGSTESMDVGGSDVRPPRYSKTSANATGVESSEQGRNEEGSSAQASTRREPSPVIRDEDETIPSPLMDISMASSPPRDSFVQDPSATNELATSDDIVETHTGELRDAASAGDSPITSQVELSEPMTSCVTEPLPRQLSLVDTVEGIIQDETVPSTSSSNSEVRSKKATHKTDRSPTRAVVTMIARTERENQEIELSSVAFPMEEGEPDCMDVTSIQNASSSQMVVHARSNRSESLVDARSNRSESIVDSRSNRRQPSTVSFTRADDSRSSTRSEGHVSFVESVPIRPARRPKHLSRSMSDTRGVRLNHRPDRLERSRRRGTEAEPRASVHHQASEPYHRASLSDPIVVAVPVSADSPTLQSRVCANNSQEAIFVASALPSSSASVTPLPSPTLESENSSPRSRAFDEVVAVPVTNTESNSSETRAVLAAVSSPRETTTVTPVPSPTAEQVSMNWSEMEQRTRGDEAAQTPSLPPPSSRTSTAASSASRTSAVAGASSSSSESTNPGAIPKPSSADVNRDNISKMLRTYVRSAQPPQKPGQAEDPRLRQEPVEEVSVPMAVPHGRGRPPRHDATEISNGSTGLPSQERGRPPSHDATVTQLSSRRRSSRHQRQHGERPHPHYDRTETNPVHLQIQDNEPRSRRATDDQLLPPNWERGVDSHGRVYYIDHANRTTTWTRPTRETPQNETNMNDINTHWQSLDRRYESFRRTLRGRNRQSRPPLPESTNQSNEGPSNTANTDTASRADTSSRPPTASTSNTPVRAESLPQPSPSSASATTTPSSSSTPATPSTPGSSGTPTSSRTPQAGASLSRPSRSGMSSGARSAALLESPAVKFIMRSDFVDFIKGSGVAGQYYFQSQMLKLIISKVRADPVNFEKYRHQVELVRFLNQFADPQIELPPAWDKKVDQNGRLYFIDHNTRTTTFIDPRLPHTGTTRRHRAGTETEPRRSRAPPPRPPPPRGHSRNNSTDATASATLILAHLATGSPFLNSLVINEFLLCYFRANIRRVQCEGERTLERFSNNVDFVMLLSLFEDQIMSFVPPEIAQKPEPASPSTSLPTSPIRTPINRKSAIDTTVKGSGGASVAASPTPYRRDFEAKVRSIECLLREASYYNHKGYGQGPNKIKMTIRRDRLLEDAYDQIMKETARSLQRNRLEIHFAGEEGLDYGGPAREFFFLISRQIFNPYYGLFEYSANDTYTVQVSPVSLYVDNSHEWFRFCGRIVGLVIIHQHLLDAFFTRTFYKALLRSPCDLSDVESLDALFHQSMTWVIENNIEDVLDLTFTVSEEIFGQVTERELIPGGIDIAVTEENKAEYVNEMVTWRVERGVSEQAESIVRGFNEVIDPNLMNIFDARELELVISGTADIDIKDWRRNTEYRSVNSPLTDTLVSGQIYLRTPFQIPVLPPSYHDSHKVVKWFWKGVSSFDNEQRLRLLQFVTGTSSIPYEGFAALRGSTGPRKFSIERWGDFSKLP
ncbi:hypothetical protein QZH41_014166, partial [Actinostola sp. cb2023]